MHGAMFSRAPLPSTVESAHWLVPRSLKAPLTQSHSWLASDLSQSFVVTCDPVAPAASEDARHLFVELTCTCPEFASRFHDCEFEPRHQYSAAESNGPPASTHSPDFVGPMTLVFL